MSQLPAVTDEYCEQLWQRVCNWQRWGADDQLGALNLITAEKRRLAAASVTDGVAIGIGNRWPVDPAPDNPWPAEHRMMRAGDDANYPGVPGLAVALDYLGVACHGIATSHIDALCHVFVRQRMYNGYPAADVKSTGALRNDLRPMADGIVTRGVLLDMPRYFGVPFLSGSVRIGSSDLDGAARKQQVLVEPGDVLLVHKGRERRKQTEGPFDPAAAGLAGLHPECAVWLKEHGVAVLGSDGMNDPQPNWSTTTNWPIPIHYLGICGMGMALMHNLDTERLARHCEAVGRWHFLLTIAPLKVPGATGSPANPVALF
jgi:kynurenine formamidase